MTDDEIVEAVAVALFHVTWPSIEWGKLGRGMSEGYRRQARAAIAAYEKAKGEK